MAMKVTAIMTLTVECGYHLRRCLGPRTLTSP